MRNGIRIQSAKQRITASLAPLQCDILGTHFRSLLFRFAMPHPPKLLSSYMSCASLTRLAYCTPHTWPELGRRGRRIYMSRGRLLFYDALCCRGALAATAGLADVVDHHTFEASTPLISVISSTGVSAKDLFKSCLLYTSPSPRD